MKEKKNVACSGSAWEAKLFLLGHRSQLHIPVKNKHLRLIIPLVSFGTPWPNKSNHKTLHFQNFLNEIFNVASIKITIQDKNTFH